MKPYVCDTALFVNEVIARKRPVLFEGAQGAFLDIDFGTYPFVTSSNTIVGGVPAAAASLRPRSTRLLPQSRLIRPVGKAPSNEFDVKMEKEIRTKGKEFGSTTGRARRCGWFDSVSGMVCFDHWRF